jgi:hypothetical protein
LFALLTVKIRFPLLIAIVATGLTSWAADVPDNLGLGLKTLAESYQTDQAQFRATMSSAKAVQADTATNRVIVNVHLDGVRSSMDVTRDLQALGLEILHVDLSWRKGVISAWLPISQATAAAKLAGVRSVMLAPPPRRRVGSVTAESSVVEHAQDVNKAGAFTPQGIRGANISVGIISDSYNKTSPNASVGIASGDLPGPGNPDGYTTPVVVLQDGTTSDTDEGRGMAEIVHDIAPAAKICFATSGPTQTSMANAIRNLRTNGQALCDIITDDIFFIEEPFFSDGPIAQAIDDVVTSDVLAGKKVVYFSAAGNEGNFAYESNLNLVTPTAGKNANDNLKFTGVGAPPAALYAGGFHNLNPGGATRIAMSVTTDANAGPTVVFQWNDPFDAGGVTTDYNLLVFDENGNYLSAKSGKENNFAIDEPIEISDLNPDTTYQFVIALASAAPPTATRLKLVSVSGDSLSGLDIAYNANAMFGHPTAANANAIGAYVYSNTPDTTPSYNPGNLNPPPGPYRPVLEDFSSNGGSIAIYFDANGDRLTNPNIRQKPEFSACDGVDTTFFPPGSGQEYDNDNFPNFFGTSASAPTAAAIGALILDAAGGPESRTPAQVRSLMEQSTFPHDLDPNFCKAIASNGVATVQVSANGNSSNDSASSATFFTVTFNGNSGETLNQLIIDLNNTPLVFDESASGFALTVGSNPSGVSLSHTLSPDNRILTLMFGNTFQSGQTISFGIDRDLSAQNAGGNSADLLAGANINATIDSNTTLPGAFANALGSGFTFADGFGLVNAKTAVASILGPLPGSTSIPSNISTRGVTSTNDNVLIGGFIIKGTGSKTVIIRAIGPTLSQYNLSGVLPDPTLTLYNANGTQIDFNDNWQDDSAQAAQIQQAGYAPPDSRESALYENLAVANYTAIVRGANGSPATGIALVEVYDIDNQPAPSQLFNISTRGPVQTNDNVMIGGFIITGSDPTNVVIRAIGPTLSQYNLSGVLANPTIELHNGQGALMTSNDNWQQDSLQAVEIQAAGLAPPNALESALFVTLNPGAYTAIVRGVNSGQGIGLVEVYNLK